MDRSFIWNYPDTLLNQKFLDNKSVWYSLWKLCGYRAVQTNQNTCSYVIYIQSTLTQVSNMTSRTQKSLTFLKWLMEAEEPETALHFFPGSFLKKMW